MQCLKLHLILYIRFDLSILSISQCKESKNFYPKQRRITKWILTSFYLETNISNTEYFSSCLLNWSTELDRSDTLTLTPVTLILNGSSYHYTQYWRANMQKNKIPIKTWISDTLRVTSVNDKWGLKDASDHDTNAHALIQCPRCNICYSS